MSEQPDPPFDNRRIVVLVTIGPHAGMHLIDGTVGEVKKATGGTLPEFVEGAEAFGRKFPMSLIRSYPRYVLFKECAGPQTSRFDEFNPLQR